MPRTWWSEAKRLEAKARLTALQPCAFANGHCPHERDINAGSQPTFHIGKVNLCCLCLLTGTFLGAEVDRSHADEYEQARERRLVR